MTVLKVCAALTAASVTSSGGAVAQGADEFAALTVHRSGTLQVDLPPDNALLLFTAPGEKIWIAEWEPRFLHGNGVEAGTVFVTTNRGSDTYWLVSEFDQARRRAKYIRVTPELFTGTVEVLVADSGAGGSTVTVCYQLTGLSAAGNCELQDTFSESAYTAMMQEWQQMIGNSRPAIDEFFPDSAG